VDGAYYRDWLDLYDLQHDALTEDAVFYVNLAAYAGLQRDDTVLELACGTGRLLAPLAEAGYRVVGLDREEAALARARQRLSPWAARARLVRGEMSDYALGERYTLVFAGLNAFMHLLTSDEQLACLHCTRRHVTDDGFLAIDMQNPLSFLGNADADALRHRFTARHPQTGDLVMQFGIEHIDEAEQTVSTSLISDVVEAGGTVTRRLSTLSLRLVFRFELEALLRAASFTPEGCYGSYDLDPYATESLRLIVLARAT
jgi:SAM-dependent methyltransferase